MLSPSSWRKAMSPCQSESWPTRCGICLRISSSPIAARRPLMTLVGKNLDSPPALNRPKAICMPPAMTTASRNASNDPSDVICASTMAASPAAGPLTLMLDPLSAPTRMPPITPEMSPESNGAPDARAIPRHSGMATRKTTTPAVRSRPMLAGGAGRTDPGGAGEVIVLVGSEIREAVQTLGVPRAPTPLWSRQMTTLGGWPYGDKGFRRRTAQTSRTSRATCPEP